MKKFLFYLFLSLYTIGFSQNPQEFHPDYKRSLEVLEEIEKEQRFVSSFSPEMETILPVGIEKEISGLRYVIGIDSMVFEPDGAYFNAFMVLQIPRSTKPLAFAARHIRFNPKGVISGNQARLALVSQHVIKLSGAFDLELPANGKNFVEWDCNGFKSVSLNGLFNFSRDLIIPDSSSMQPQVKAEFTISTTDIRNFLIGVSITPFQIKHIKDFSFSVSQAYIDLSDTQNPPGFSLPSGYSYNAPSPLAWTGFYLQNLKIKLPPQLCKKDQPQQEISVNGFIIDASGLSGSVSLTNVLTYGQATIGTWKFGINELTVGFLSNHLNGGQLKGELALPLNDYTKVNFTAGIFENPSTEKLDYLFSVSPGSGIRFDAFFADINLHPGSYVQVKTLGNTWEPSACLTGNIEFLDNNSKFPQINFQNLTLIDQKPYVTNGIFALTGSGSNPLLGGLPVSLNAIALKLNGEQPPVLCINAGLNFMDASDQGFSAAVGAEIKMKYKNNPNLSPLSFEKVLINDVSVAVHSGAIKLIGALKFTENDPLYGKCFKGMLDLSLIQMTFNVNASMIFGRVNSMRYFYVDGAAVFPTPVPIPPVFAAYGFGGGMYYHMKPRNLKPESNMIAIMKGVKPPPDYIPDADTKLGVLFGMTVGLNASDKMMNGDVSLEIKFNQNNGMDLVRMRGDVVFFTSITEKKTKPADKLFIYGTTDTYFDALKSEFHSVSNIKVNVKGIITGNGQAVFHKDPKDWYIYIGRPGSRLNLNVLGLANFGSYFMAGNKIDDPPSIPTHVNVNYNPDRNISFLSAGNGIIAGASLSFDDGREIGFPKFKLYYQVHAGSGFDAMLANYDKPWHCSGSPDPPGLKGWFAQGQLWAYINGDAGAKGQILKKDFDLRVCTFGFSALLQGHFPNPFYATGQAHGHYDILGLIKGDFDVSFSAGQNCNLSGS